MASSLNDKELRATRCDDCAFTAGTEANKCSITRLKTKLCVDGVLPFYCHRREGLCAGWAEAVNIMDAKGHYVRLRGFQQEAAEGCLEVIELAEEKAARGESVTEQSIIDDIMNVFGDIQATASP